MFRRSLVVLVLATSCSSGSTTPHGGIGGAAKPHDVPVGIDDRLVDQAANPCEDFYKYACGNWSKVYPMPADQNRFGTGNIVYENNEQVLHSLLDKVASNDSHRSANEQKTGDTYASCMNVEHIDKLGLAPFKPMLDKIAAVTDKTQLGALAGELTVMNVGAFLSFGSLQDFKDATRQIAAVDQGGIGLPERDYYVRDDDKSKQLRTGYVKHIAKTLTLLGSSGGDADRDAQAIMAFETELAKASLDLTARRDIPALYHVLPVAELAKLTPSFDYKAMFAATGAPVFSELEVTHPPFFQALDKLIQATDLATLKVYLRWQYIHSVPSTSLPSALDSEKFAFFGKDLAGLQEQRARWKRCVAVVDTLLGESLGQVYVAQEFQPATKAAAAQMVKDIEAAMDADIDTLAWMSAPTKAKAKDKLRSVADKIGYPDHFRDYTKVEIIRDDELGNETRATSFEQHRQLAKIGQPVDRGEWGMTPPTVDAYYNPSMNDINFPAGILQPPFYDPRSSDQVNYGRIGAVVGHELTHGFDDQGRIFDGKGNMTDWWQGDDGKKFEQLAQCEIDEYGAFTAVDDLKVNGKATLGENTADNGGLRLAYAAFLTSAKRKSIDPEAKQGAHTPAQEFFLAFGQNWCGEQRAESLRNQIQTDVHSPIKFRVNGVVQNMPEFGKVFSCKAGQPMMPEKPCRVW